MRQRKTFQRILGLFVLLVCLWSLPLQAQDQERPFRLQIGAVDLIPQEGVRASLMQEEKYQVIQFYEIPHSAHRSALKEKGMELLGYLGGCAYLARIDAKNPELLEVQGIRATLGYAPEMKMSRLFYEAEHFKEALQAGTSVDILVRFHKDVAFERAAVALHRAWAVFEQKDYAYPTSVSAAADWRSLRMLLESDQVEWVDIGLPPRGLHNQDSAALTHVNVVRQNQEYRNISGKRIRVGIWDEGPVGSHVDLEGRVTIVEIGEISDHATHVSGTIGGKGLLDPRGAGMAPRSLIFSYDLWGDVVSEMLRANQNYGVLIANHSWGHYSGWYGPSGTGWHWYGDELFGYYHAATGALDQFIREKDFPSIKSAGNTRDGSFLGPHRHGGDITEFQHDLHPPNPDFGCLTILSVAKNALVVGAVMKDKVITAFSSTGPTDDGRVKPDVVAPGFQIRSTMPDDKYRGWNGTSMSAPAVTGISTLLIDYYQRLTKKDMRAAQLKALLVHSAEDLGNPGPDYVFGHGLVDAELASRVLRAASGGQAKYPDDLEAVILKGSIDHKDKLTYEFAVPYGAKELRATLVWNDPPGSKLVNNLDLWLRSSEGKKVKPYALKPRDPTAPAVRKRNTRDNVEHIRVESPASGTWKVRVSGAKIPEGPQKFFLIVSAGSGNRPFPVQTEGAMRLTAVQTYTMDSLGKKTKTGSFSKGDALLFNYAGKTLSNAQYQGYFGTVSINIYVLDATGKLLLKFKAARQDFRPGNFSLWSDEYKIPDGMPPGTYRVETAITMHNGAGDRAVTTFSVQ
ncbi:MAG: S8 family serine peptidase [Candidatus Aminicenantaceae bacterium]